VERGTSFHQGMGLGAKPPSHEKEIDFFHLK